MLEVKATAKDRLLEQIEHFSNGMLFIQTEQKNKILSTIDQLFISEEGFDFVYEQINKIVHANMFKGGPWENANGLVPALTSGTLKAGFPNMTYEILSTMRVLAIAEKKLKVPGINSQEAYDYIDQMLVHNLDLVFEHLNEQDRIKLTDSERSKLKRYFDFVLKHISLDSIKGNLSIELKAQIAQRPIDTYKIRDLVQLIEVKLHLDDSKNGDEYLSAVVNAIERPSTLSKDIDAEEYARVLENQDPDALEREAKELSAALHDFGMASAYHVKFVLKFYQSHPELVKKCLALTSVGEAEWDKHAWFISQLISNTLESSTRQFIYGLSCLLDRGLLSREAVYTGLKSLLKIKVHSKIEEKLGKSHWSSENTSALKTLLAGTICVLGQPLGIGQGLNPTCQSARGISLWSEHAPGKLLNMLIIVAEYDNLEFRFEGQLLESAKLQAGLAKDFDYTLDPVSIVLVPHLDRIYNEMMLRASGRGEDPHKWVNPALYGHWISTGFTSSYNYLTNSIHKYDHFLRLFVASFHPEYNGKRKLIYPVPTGIYITSAEGEMLGFHAVSLLRVGWNNDKTERRIYFLNPNNEGRQDWGQQITPTVSGNGERAGESSLPFHQFASRVYAFHYNQMGVDERLEGVDDKYLQRIKTYAENSWGKKYHWT